MSQPNIAKGERAWTGIMRKLVTGVTGLALVGFVIVHLLGNLTLFKSTGDSFNAYAHFLESQGILLYVAEFMLVLFFGMHAYTGIKIWLGKKKARPDGYEKYESAGRKSLQSTSSKSMVFTGIVLLVFLVFHVSTFKFNVHLGQEVVEAEYMTTLEGVDGEVRDLYQIVWDAFANPIVAFGYTAVMLLLGLHLRHGVWSALQSLGAMKPQYTPAIYTGGAILAILLAVGFLAIPLYIFFTGGGA